MIMIDDSSLLISVFKILPDDIDFYVQAPSLEDETILNMMDNTGYAYYKLIKLDSLKKRFFINHLETHSAVQYFQNIEIKNGDTLLFQGFDGIEFGILSKNVKMPEWFKEKCIDTGDCTISNDW